MVNHVKLATLVKLLAMISEILIFVLKVKAIVVQMSIMTR